MTLHQDSSIDPLLGEAGWAQRLGRALAADSHAGEDAVQDTWVAALEGRMHRDAVARRWMAKVARNFTRSGRRKERAVRHAERQAARPESSDSGPAEIVARAELLQKVSAAVLELREPYRSTLLMRYLDGLSAEEIARRQEVSGSTVRNRLRRGLAQARAKLSGRNETWSEAWAALLAWRPSLELTEVLTVTKGTKIAVAGALVLTAGVWMWSGIDAPRTAVEAEAESGRTLRGALDEPAVAEDAVDPAPAERERTEVAAAVPVEAPRAALAPSTPAEAGVFLRMLVVVDHQNEPVPDVEVELPGTLEGEVERLWTDASGRCELRRPPGDVEVQLFKPEVGIARADVAFSSELDGELAQVRIVKPIHVVGRVVHPDGRPARGATVGIRMQGVIISEDIPFTPEPVDTDSEGRFELQLHSRGVFVIGAELDEVESQEVEVGLSKGHRQEIELRLMGAHAVEGTLAFFDGRPAEGASLRIEEEGGEGDLASSRTGPRSRPTGPSASPCRSPPPTS